MSLSSPDQRAGDAVDAPAGALSDVWVLLDELPRGAASSALTATTIEMAAVAAAPVGGREGRAGIRAWVGPAAVVATALVAGLIVGRATAPDPDRRLLEHLPIVRHLDLLRESGSVTFLEAASGRGGPPLRMVVRQGPEAARQDAAEFTESLASLGRLLRADVAARRSIVADLTVEERAELERSLREFTALSAAERKTLATVAEALADPARPELRAAALDWHRWLASSRPEDRGDIIASNADKRLDWIDWYASRVEGRGWPGQSDRPPPGGRWPPRGDYPPGPDGRFRRPPRDEAAGPRTPPVRPDAPAPPPETPAPPG
jgi:hypothetical protein